MLVSIDSPTGEHQYELSRHRWGFVVYKLKDGEVTDEVYQCWTDERGNWACSCGDFIWRKELLGQPCKHLVIVKEIWDA